MNLRIQKGFSLVELMVALVILAIIASIAAPSLSSYMDHRRVIEVAEAVYGQLQYARSEAISRSETVYVNFSTNDTTTWKMGISTTSGCDVDQAVAGVADDCTLVVSDGDANLDPGDGTVDTGDLLYYGLDSDDHPFVSLGADGDSATVGEINQIVFNAVRGTVNSETVYITFGDAYEVRVVLFVTGRIRFCSPAGATYVGGYSEC